MLGQVGVFAARYVKIFRGGNARTAQAAALTSLTKIFSVDENFFSGRKFFQRAEIFSADENFFSGRKFFRRAETFSEAMSESLKPLLLQK